MFMAGVKVSCNSRGDLFVVFQIINPGWKQRRKLPARRSESNWIVKEWVLLPTLDSDKADVHNVLPKFLESDGEFAVETGD